MQLFIVVFFVIALLVALKVGIEESEKKREEERKRQERLEQEKLRMEQEKERKRKQLLWEKRYQSIKENTDNEMLYAIATKPYLGTNFYVSSYKCPNCGRVLYKTVFPLYGEYRIETEKGVVWLKRVFTCEQCKKFLSALPGGKLSDGIFIEKNFVSNYDYQKMLTKMDSCGTKIGRMDG